MKDGSIFSTAYQKVLSDLPDLTAVEKQIALSDDFWHLELSYFKKFNHLQLEFEIKSLIATIDFPRFDLYKKPMKLFGFFTIGAYSAHLDGKLSALSDHFCELKSTDFLLEQTDAHLGWNNKNIKYLAKLNEKQIENLIHVFNCIEYTCVNTVNVLEVI